MPKLAMCNKKITKRRLFVTKNYTHVHLWDIPNKNELFNKKTAG